MKILMRLISLPFAWVIWTVKYSYDWLRYGGGLFVNSEKPVISPEVFIEEIRDLHLTLLEHSTAKVYLGELYELLIDDDLLNEETYKQEVLNKVANFLKLER